MTKVTVFGAGSYGTTLGQILDDNKCDVLLFDVNKDHVNQINNQHTHPLFDFETSLSHTIKATTLLEEAVEHGDLYVICVPTKFIRGLLADINKIMTSKKLFVIASKGVEPDTGKVNSVITAEEINETNLDGIVILTGPSHAEELIQRKLTVLSSVSEDMEKATYVQKLFNNTTYLRVYSQTDVVGAEMGGAVKNAIAFISGVVDGLGYGINARSALITRGMLEMVRIVNAYGGKAETAYGLTGLGDLIVTASSELSRNFSAGKKVGQGGSVDDVVNNSKMTVEGVRSIKACVKIAEKYDLYLPILNVAYDVLFKNYPVDEAIRALLSNDLKSE